MFAFGAEDEWVVRGVKKFALQRFAGELTELSAAKGRPNENSLGGSMGRGARILAMGRTDRGSRGTWDRGTKGIGKHRAGKTI